MTVRTYLDHISPTVTSPTQPIYGREHQMHENAAKGFVFTVDDWTRLTRWLILGSEKGTYYATEQALTRDNAKVVERCIKADGLRAVRLIVDVSINGRAPKNDQAVFALALAAKTGDDATRKAALNAMPQVCRTGTHLFAFAEAVEAFGGWSRGTRTAVGRWYGKYPKDLAYQVTKYAQRNGWTHRDMLRLAHVKPAGDRYNAVYRYIVKGEWTPIEGDGDAEPGATEVNAYMAGIVAIKGAATAKDVARLVRDHRLPREVVPTEYLDSPDVWNALLVDMPMTAMIRNLATMTRIGLIAPLSDGTRLVCDKLRNPDYLRRARVHPMNALMALKTYQAGRGVRGQHTWTPVQTVMDALNDAFYGTIDALEPTGKRWFIGLDSSGSMNSGAVGGIVGLSPIEAAAAMALITVRSEPQAHVIAFDTAPHELRFSRSMRLDDAIREARKGGGGTDCGIPFAYAMRNCIPADVFVTYTDNVNWSGIYSQTHPAQALQQYRQGVAPQAKFVSVGLTATADTIADVDDARSLSLVGFDSAAPALIADFARN